MAHIGEAVAVLVDQEGAPIRFRWREKTYLVVTRPVRWFSKTEWWVGDRAPKGVGSNSIELEVWKFLASENDARSTFVLLHNKVTNSWRLLNGQD
jgi:hypothetical protein